MAYISLADTWPWLAATPPPDVVDAALGLAALVAPTTVPVLAGGDTAAGVVFGGMTTIPDPLPAVPDPDPAWGATATEGPCGATAGAAVTF